MILGNNQIIDEVLNNRIIIDPINKEALEQIEKLKNLISFESSFIPVPNLNTIGLSIYRVEELEIRYKRIKHFELDIERIIQEKFPQLQGVSYDLSLDKFFIDFEKDKFWHDPSKVELDKVICCGTAHSYPLLRKHTSDNFSLQPYERCLASTKEKIGSNCLDITTKIFSKSSWARWGLEVASCAGYGDPGYANHWTLEIVNKNPFPVVLREGMIIGQISFEYVKGCSKIYKSKYNNNGIIEEYSDNDRFDMMIPKLIKITN